MGMEGIDFIWEYTSIIRKKKKTFLNLNPWFQELFYMLCDKWEVLKNTYAAK